MKNTIFFTHIPKTSGSSFKKYLIEPNFNEREIYMPRGRLDILTKLNKSKIKVVQGHIKFGVHHFIDNKPIYITFLRDPIQRAISHYFFVKQCKFSTYIHPDFSLVESFSIDEFFKLKFRDNLQTRFIAGYGYDKEIKNSDKLLAKAIENLDKYYQVIGIKERFEESLYCFKKYFNWKLSMSHEYQEQKTMFKKQIKDIDDDVIYSITQSHELDIQLYNFAVKKFESQLINQRNLFEYQDYKYE